MASTSISSPANLSPIMGQSGSSKSTLLNILGELDGPTGSTVLINGVDISMHDDDALADSRSAGIGFIFQFHHLLDEYTSAAAAR
jgi:ABC-type lipoprotein export system ATPase subunit